MNPISDKLANSTTLSALSNIFDMLDHDKDGKIDPDKIDLSRFDQISLEHLKPLLLELEQGRHTLNK